MTSNNLDMPQVTPGHRSLIERLFISSHDVRSISDTVRAIYLGYGNSVMVDGSRLPPSVKEGSTTPKHILELQDVCTMVASSGHRLRHFRLFMTCCMSNCSLMTLYGWHGSHDPPNIFQSCRRLEHEAVVDSSLP